MGEVGRKHTDLGHRHHLDLDPKIRTLVHYNTRLTLLWDIERRRLFFCHLCAASSIPRFVDSASLELYRRSKRLEQMNKKNPLMRIPALIKRALLSTTAPFRSCPIAATHTRGRVPLPGRFMTVESISQGTWTNSGRFLSFRPMLHDPQNSTELLVVRGKIAGYSAARRADDVH